MLEHVSQADGLLLWCLYSHCGLRYWSGKRYKQPQLASESFQWSVSTIQGAWGHGFKPCELPKFLLMKFNSSLEGMISMLKLTFLYHFYHIQLYRCYLWIFLRLFLHPLDSLSKLLTPPCTHIEFTLFLFYPNTHQPYLGNSQLVCALGTKFPTTSIRNYSVISALIIFKSFCMLGRWQLVWWSVIKPTSSMRPSRWGKDSLLRNVLAA